MNKNEKNLYERINDEVMSENNIEKMVDIIHRLDDVDEKFTVTYYVEKEHKLEINVTNTNSKKIKKNTTANKNLNTTLLNPVASLIESDLIKDFVKLKKLLTFNYLHK